MSDRPRGSGLSAQSTEPHAAQPTCDNCVRCSDGKSVFLATAEECEALGGEVIDSGPFSCNGVDLLPDGSSVEGTVAACLLPCSCSQAEAAVFALSQPTHPAVDSFAEKAC